MNKRSLLAALCVASALLAAQTLTAESTKDPKPGKKKSANPKETGNQSFNNPVVAVEPFADVKARDEGEKAKFFDRQQALLAARYELGDNPSPVKMSGGKKYVQQGVRVKLPAGATWESLAKLTPQEIKDRDLFPAGFLPLPHVKHAAGGQVFPKVQIDGINAAEARSLQRFDTDFDLPDHLTPEFPAPIFLQNRPELGDVSQGKLLTTKNFFDIFNGKLTPVQLDGLRQLLTPFPQAEFNMTDSRKVDPPQLGVTCLDCHSNFHTNAAFHLNPDTRPQVNRFRLDTPSLRGVFNQQIHGSKRSLRSIEDFTEFEQRTAYFNGDQVDAARKGVNLPDRSSQVALMAQVQNMIDFPPAPKLLADGSGRLDPAQATEAEKLGEQVFFGKGKCALCHKPDTFMDDKMHDQHLERFFKPKEISDQLINGDGPMKTFTLRGIKDSPPYLHDGRLLTLEDTVEFFNLVLGTNLEAKEKEGLVAYMRQL